MVAGRIEEDREDATGTKGGAEMARIILMPFCVESYVSVS